MLHKSFEIIETKAEGDSGEFTALVSTFGNVDKVGDRIVKGAYRKTLAKWRGSGDPLPIILAHQWDDVMAHVGYANPHEVKETDRGLLVKGKLDVEDNPVARQVHKLMKRRTLREFSIGYGIPEGGQKRADDGANELTEIDLVECGPCLKGIDPKTELRAVKSALGVEEPPTPDELREKAKQAEREAELARIPDVPEQPEAPAEPEIDVLKELQEVKDRLAKAEAEVEDLRKKAEEADREPRKARSADPLRQRADEMALRYASGGLNGSQPPAPVARPQPELMPLGELKQRMRDEMLKALSGDIDESL